MMVGSSSSTVNDDNVIDNTNATSLLLELISNNKYKSSESCIFKTPSILFRHNQSAYLPNGFSIGPLHHNNPNLKATEVIKLKYLNDFLSRNCAQEGSFNSITELSEKPTPAASHQETYLSKLIQAITEVEDDARACYAVQVEFTKEEFVKMLVIDGCFLVELFCRDCFFYLRTVNDPIFNMPCMKQFLWHDLALLENQIPWLVIERLYTMSLYSKYAEYSLFELAVRFLARKFLVDEHMNVSECKNIVDLLRSALISSSELLTESEAEPEPNFFEKFCSIFSRSKKVETSREWAEIPSASSLVEAGIELKSSPSKCILDIQFRNGILHVPTIEIDENTEDIFRNLISYEQCCNFLDGQRITHYVILLDHLINTIKDLRILCDRQIIQNWIDPVKATDMFNNIYHDTCINVPSYYEKIEKEVDAHCRRRWPRWRAAYVRNYFSTPWAIASQVVAGILLTLTLLQTIFTIKG